MKHSTKMRRWLPALALMVVFATFALPLTVQAQCSDPNYCSTPPVQENNDVYTTGKTTVALDGSTLQIYSDKKTSDSDTGTDNGMFIANITGWGTPSQSVSFSAEGNTGFIDGAGDDGWGYEIISNVGGSGYTLIIYKGNNIIDTADISSITPPYTPHAVQNTTTTPSTTAPSINSLLPFILLAGDRTQSRCGRRNQNTNNLLLPLLLLSNDFNNTSSLLPLLLLSGGSPLSGNSSNDDRRCRRRRAREGE